MSLWRRQEQTTGYRASNGNEPHDTSRPGFDRFAVDGSGKVVPAVFHSFNRDLIDFALRARMNDPRVAHRAIRQSQKGGITTLTTNSLQPRSICCIGTLTPPCACLPDD